jgi:hypothetical protein
MTNTEVDLLVRLYQFGGDAPWSGEQEAGAALSLQIQGIVTASSTRGDWRNRRTATGHTVPHGRIQDVSR